MEQLGEKIYKDIGNVKNTINECDPIYRFYVKKKLI